MTFNVDVDNKGKIVKISPMPVRAMKHFIGSDFSILEQMMIGHGKYIKIIRRAGNPSEENKDSITLVHGDELFDMDIVNNDPWSLANRHEVRISSDKELLASYVDLEEGIVIAAVFDSFSLRYYSFDVVVDRRYQRIGLGKKLIDIAMQKFYELQDDCDDCDDCRKTTLLLHVINPVLVPYLIKEYDLVVTNEFNNESIMSDK